MKKAFYCENYGKFSKYLELMRKKLNKIPEQPVYTPPVHLGGYWDSSNIHRDKKTEKTR